MIDPTFVSPLQDVLFVARVGSVAGAAQRLHKTPSAVSQQIRRVESHFGMQIFERRGRGVVLTPQGEAAIGAVNRLFDEAESVFGALTMLAATPTTVLRVAASDYLGRRLLLPVLRRLLTEGVPVRFEITTAHSSAARRAVETGEADLAVVTAAEPDGVRDVLRETTLCEQGFYSGGAASCRAPPEPRSAHRQRASGPPLGQERGAPNPRRIPRWPGPPSRLDDDVPSVILMLSYVRAGLGVGLAPALALEGLGSRVSNQRRPHRPSSREAPDADQMTPAARSRIDSSTC